MERNKARTIQVLTWIITAAALLALAMFIIWRAGGINGFAASGDNRPSDGLDSGAGQVDTAEGYTELSHVTYEADEVRLIDINTSSDRVRIQAGPNNEDVHVRRLVRDDWAKRYAGDDNRRGRMMYDDLSISSSLEEGDLLIRNSRRGGWFLNIFTMGRPEPVTEVLIPESLMDRNLDLQIDASSGRISVGAISFDALYLELSSGDVSFAGTEANSASFDMSSGSVKAEGVSFDQVYHDSSSGNLLLEGHVDEIDIDISSGKVTMDLDQVPAMIYTDMSSGSVEINMPVEGASAVNVRVDKSSGSVGGLAADGAGELLGDYRVDISSGSFTINAND